MKGDAHFLPFKDESFDSVFAGEIIEHLANPSKFLEEIERVLSKNGTVVITTPFIVVYIRKILFGEKTLSHSDKTGHIYAWDLPLLLRLIRRATNLNIIIWLC